MYFCGWNKGGTTGEGMDGGVFVCGRSVAVEWNVLVGVCGFAVYVEI